ncbi:hypothetical protein OS493_001930 [Desmophyllum pertusum]|uniref:Uncharacterized protein n=1 Tax=Desmophyllum pertusum TaxID=174260 RepID=A0A9W9Z532_9CNID|nr:hypothetical protein OS493_001930 [Desmophyllum pertusum]
MDIVVSQQTTSSGSQYVPSVGDSQQDNTCSSQDSQDASDKPDTKNTYKERVFLVYEEQLKELLRFCPRCGSLIIQESTVEVQNEGSQLSLKLTCINNLYHSLYLKYLPKLQHFTHDVMKVGTMLAVLDHNFNANRPQALIQAGESQGDQGSKFSWSQSV